MDFSAMFNTWMKVLTKPNEETFQQEVDSPQATLGTALTWILIAAVVVGALSFLTSVTALGQMGQMEEMFRNDPDIPPEMAELFSSFFSRGGMTGMMGAGFLVSIFLAPFFFLVGTGFFYLIGMLLGGKGDFGRYAYLIATFQAPLSVASALVGLVPLLGACVSIAIGVYQLFLSYLATKVGLNLSSGRALVVVLTPLILLISLVACFVIFLSAAIFSAGGSTAP